MCLIILSGTLWTIYFAYFQQQHLYCHITLYGQITQHVKIFKYNIWQLARIKNVTRSGRLLSFRLTLTIWEWGLTISPKLKVKAQVQPKIESESGLTADFLISNGNSWKNEDVEWKGDAKKTPKITRATQKVPFDRTPSNHYWRRSARSIGFRNVGRVRFRTLEASFFSLLRRKRYQMMWSDLITGCLVMLFYANCWFSWEKNEGKFQGHIVPPSLACNWSAKPVAVFISVIYASDMRSLIWGYPGAFLEKNTYLVVTNNQDSGK